jgi:ketosteroid isomerase-like protein
MGKGTEKTSLPFPFFYSRRCSCPIPHSPFPVPLWIMANKKDAPVTTGTLEAFLAAFNAHDLDAIMDFFAEDCEFDMPRGKDPWGTRYVGKRAVREGLAARFTGIPDVHYGDDAHWVAGDRAVSTWLLTGTSTTGEAIRVRGVDLLYFREGKIVKKDSYWKIVQK